MGPLVATGGIHVPEEAIKPLETALDELCGEVGFPPGQPFKWSPGRDLWMHDELVDAEREAFFTRALALAQENGVKGCVVVEDTDHGRAAADVITAEEDVVRLFLERADNHVRGLGRRGRPPGWRPSG